MKKIVALIVCLLLACSMCVSYAEESNVFLVNFLGNMTLTAEEWYATEEARENLAATAIFEALMQDVDPAVALEALTNDAVYTVLNDDIVSVFFFGNAEILYFAYLPSLAAATINMMECTSDPDAVMAGLQQGGSFAEYKKVDVVKVQEVMSKALSEE